MDKIKIIERVCNAIYDDNLDQASKTLADEYPFEYVENSRPGISKQKALRILRRDKFTDRYTGQQLLFPPVLAVISYNLPAEFPSHNNWKFSETHQAYWDLCPMIDHVIPVVQGGNNCDDNLVTTSPITNARKSQFTPEQAGLNLMDPTELNDWDGMLPWFMDYVRKYPEFLDKNVPGVSVKSWYSAAQSAS